jgi:hypothetical protein
LIKKIAIYLFLGHPNYRRSSSPQKEYPAVRTENSSLNSFFVGLFAFLDSDHELGFGSGSTDPLESEFNPDQDLKHL